MAQYNATLILRDLCVHDLILNGVHVGDPKAPHPDYKGGFRGYFQAPRDDTIEFEAILNADGTRRTNKISVCIEDDFDLPVAVYVLDFEKGEFKRESDEMIAHFSQLALSGSMRAAGALRPFPMEAIQAGKKN